MANERKEFELEDKAGCIDGVRVGEEVSQVLRTLFSKLLKRRLGKPKI